MYRAAESQPASERILSWVAIATAGLALAVWTIAGLTSLGGRTAPKKEPLAEVNFGQFPTAPEAVRVLHWTTGKRPASLTKGSSIDVPTGPEALVTLPDGRLAMLCRGAGVLAVVDPRGKDPVRQIPLAGKPSALCLAGDGKVVWVALGDKSQVARVDLVTGKATATATCGKAPEAMALSPDGSRLLVTNTASDDLTIIDTGNAQAVATVPVGRGPRGVVIHPTKPFATVALGGGEELAKVEWRKGKLEGLLPIGRGPSHIVQSADGDILYVSLSGSADIVKYDRDDALKLGSCWLEKGSARSLVLGPGGRALFASAGDAGWAFVIDTSEMKVTAATKTEVLPEGVALSEDGRTLWLANRGTSTLWSYAVGWTEADKALGGTESEDRPRP